MYLFSRAHARSIGLSFPPPFESDFDPPNCLSASLGIRFFSSGPVVRVGETFLPGRGTTTTDNYFSLKQFWPPAPRASPLFCMQFVPRRNASVFSFSPPPSFQSGIAGSGAPIISFTASSPHPQRVFYSPFIVEMFRRLPPSFSKLYFSLHLFFQVLSFPVAYPPPNDFFSPLPFI